MNSPFEEFISYDTKYSRHKICLLQTIRALEYINAALFACMDSWCTAFLLRQFCDTTNANLDYLNFAPSASSVSFVVMQEHAAYKFALCIRLQPIMNIHTISSRYGILLFAIAARLSPQECLSLFVCVFITCMSINAVLMSCLLLI